MDVVDLDHLIGAIATGDASAFGHWMAGAEAPLRRSLRGFARSVDAEAVLQETLLRTWQVAPRFEPDGRPNGLLRLAHRIARNLAISETRRARAVAGDVEEMVSDPSLMPHPPDPHLRRAIEDCRRKLPDKPAAALAARLNDAGARHDLELAEDLGMTKNTFLQNFTRARKFIARCLEELGVDLSREWV